MIVAVNGFVWQFGTIKKLGIFITTEELETLNILADKMESCYTKETIDSVYNYTTSLKAKYNPTPIDCRINRVNGEFVFKG